MTRSSTSTTAHSFDGVWCRWTDPGGSNCSPDSAAAGSRSGGRPALGATDRRTQGVAGTFGALNMPPGRCTTASTTGRVNGVPGVPRAPACGMTGTEVAPDLGQLLGPQAAGTMGTVHGQRGGFSVHAVVFIVAEEARARACGAAILALNGTTTAATASRTTRSPATFAGATSKPHQCVTCRQLDICHPDHLLGVARRSTRGCDFNG